MRNSSTTPDQTALLQCNRLGKNYGRTTALSNITLSLHSGPPIALIGPNGAGKTTLLSLLCGFIRPTEGSITVLGVSPGSTEALAKVSALPQDALLDPVFSISRQLRHYAQLKGMSSRSAHHDTDRVLDLVQLGDRGGNKPIELSHGMRKRVMIAQALIGTPELVLLDEPTAGIDPPNVRIIRDIISAEASKTTFIISSHNLDELEKVCTSVIQLRHGQLQRFSTIDADTTDGRITLTLKQSHATTAIARNLENTEGVISATQTNPTELVIEYDNQAHPHLDITLLQMLADNQCPYRKLIKGRSLEEQLFSTD